MGFCAALCWLGEGHTLGDLACTNLAPASNPNQPKKLPRRFLQSVQHGSNSMPDDEFTFSLCPFFLPLWVVFAH